MSRVYCCRISSLGPREVFERPSACEGSCFAGEATLHWVVRQSGKGEVNFALVKFRKFYRRRVMTPLDALGDSFVGGAFRRRGLKLPRMIITTFSIHLRNNLVGSGEFITALPRSVLQIYRRPHLLKELPVDLSVQPPLAIVTLRNRTLTPGVQLFIQCARDVAQSFARGGSRRTRTDIISA